MLKQIYKRIGVLICSLAFIPACSGARPDDLGVKDGKLLGCPGPPNCVSTFAADEKHQIDPLKYSGGREQLVVLLKTLIAGMGNAEVVTENKNYLHVEFASKMLKFVDDVEFLLDDQTKTMHFRSASRMGYGDFGVNRKRIDTIKKLLAQKVDG